MDQLPYELINIIIEYAALPEPGGIRVAESIGMGFVDWATVTDAFVANHDIYIVRVLGNEIVSLKTGDTMLYRTYNVSDADAVIVLTNGDILYTDEDWNFKKFAGQLPNPDALDVVYGIDDNVIYTGKQRTCNAPSYAVTELLRDVYELSVIRDGAYHRNIYTTCPLVDVDISDGITTVTRVTSTYTEICIATYVYDCDNVATSRSKIYYPNTFGTIIRISHGCTVYCKPDGGVFIMKSILGSSDD